MIHNPLYTIPLLLLFLNNLTYANTLQEDIINTQTQITTLQLNLKKLQEQEALLPQSVQQRKDALRAAQIKENALHTHTEFGFITTSGNTNTKAYALDFDIKKGWNKHKFDYALDAHFTEDNDIETTNKFFTELVYNYEFTPRFAFSYLTGYKEDKFSGYNYQFYTGSGAKYKFIKKEKHDLSFEANILYAQDQTENSHFTTTGVAIVYPNPSSLVKDSTRSLKGKTEKYTSAQIKAVYAWQILENLKFIQDFSYRTQTEYTQNYFVFSKSAFTSKISDLFSLGLNYKVDYANRPPEGIQHADKTLTASLIIDY